MNSTAPEITNQAGTSLRDIRTAQRTVSALPTELQYFRARDIARALNASKKAVQRLAEREQWPSRINGNRLEFCPPEQLQRFIIAAPESAANPRTTSVRFADLAHSDAQREKVLLREKAVKLLEANAPTAGKEVALQLVCNLFEKEHAMFPISASSLRRWAEQYAASGLDGLVEQKRGRVGRKSFVNDLDEETLLRTQAAAIEHGAGGRLNIARAYRNLVSDPTVGGPARQWLHGAHASKSYVPPSVRKAVTTSALGVKLIQVGPKAMKLDGPFSECHYDDCPAGHAFTADDMTANVYVWVEWPNEQGFLLIRPQILAAMDIGSMYWLTVRAIIRPKGQYNKDDVWGLIGDVMDDYGRYKIAVLEGGTWQSNVVIGEKTGLSDDERFGGLKSLGVKVIHTRTPRGKIIETAFNQLQYAADNCKGFCGRAERDDAPEAVKAALYQVKAGHAHPRQYFLHLNEYTAHLAAVMNNLNHERNDGKILKGRCALDKWTEDAPKLEKFPDEAKWMYRSSYRVLEVTRNGVRVTVGSGKFQTHYTYANPALEVHRGRRVVVFWNDYDPDTDAVIYTLKNGRQDKLICVASRVAELSRFGATDEQFAAEAARKKLQMQVAVTESRSLAPYLQRPGRAGTPLPAASGVQKHLDRAKATQESRTRTKRNARQFSGDASRLLDTNNTEERFSEIPNEDVGECGNDRLGRGSEVADQSLSVEALLGGETM